MYEKETKYDEVFGNLCRIGQASDWWSEGLKMTLFGNEVTVQLAIEVKDEDPTISESQYSAGRELLNNLEKYQSIITNNLTDFFNTKDLDKINSSITINELRISKVGHICLIMECSEGADETLFSGISKDVIFTDTFRFDY